MKRIVLFCLLVFCLVFSVTVSAQTSSIIWQKSLGGSGDDRAYSVKQTTDGGYIVAGYTLSNNYDVSVNYGGADYLVVRLDSSGATIWKKTFGGSGDDKAYTVQQTTDGGYIVAGASNSAIVDVNGTLTSSGNHGNSDYWIVKLDTSGNIMWQKSLGGSGVDWAASIQQTTDGGYIVAGVSNSTTVDVNGTPTSSGNHGGYDYWVVKLTSTGDITWQQSLGGAGDDRATSIQQTTDGKYIVAGTSSSTTVDINGIPTLSENHGVGDYWVVKLDPSGTLLWQKSLGGSRDEEAYSIQQTFDPTTHLPSGYIVAGYTDSDDSTGDVTGHHHDGDYWIVKLSPDDPLFPNTAPSIQWQKSLGGNGLATGGNWANSIQQVVDGGYIVAGNASSYAGDVTGHHGADDVGNYDYWLVKLRPDDPLSLNTAPAIQWQKCLGGSDSDYAYSIQQTFDPTTHLPSGYIVAGYSYSADDDVVPMTGDYGHHGNYDYWIVKLDTTLDDTTVINEAVTKTADISVYPNPTAGPFIVNFDGVTNTVITISNSAGQDIFSTEKLNSSSLKLDLSNNAKGLYFVTVQGEDKKGKPVKVTKKVTVR